MPLDKIERDVLEVICEEHRQTHRGAKAMIVHVGMNAKTGGQKAHISQALHALYRLGLVAHRDDAWLPTLEGKAALDVSASDWPSWTGFDTAKPGADEKAPNSCDECGAVLCPMDAKQYGEICNNCFKDLEEAPISALAGALPEFNATVERTADPLPDDLLNRCAAMNSTLLALAEQAAADGYKEAWSDLAWLIETGKQLVAAGGDS